MSSETEAVGPYVTKKQITQNTFDIDIHAIKKRMRPVFHTSERIQWEVKEIDPVDSLPPYHKADIQDFLTEEEHELI